MDLTFQWQRDPRPPANGTDFELDSQSLHMNGPKTRPNSGRNLSFSGGPAYPKTSSPQKMLDVRSTSNQQVAQWPQHTFWHFCSSMEFMCKHVHNSVSKVNAFAHYWIFFLVEIFPLLSITPAQSNGFSRCLCAPVKWRSNAKLICRLVDSPSIANHTATRTCQSWHCCLVLYAHYRKQQYACVNWGVMESFIKHTVWHVHTDNKTCEASVLNLDCFRTC